MAFIMYVFYRFASAGIYVMISVKYLQASPGISCKHVLDNYSENLPTLAYQELFVMMNVWSKYDSVNATNE